MQNVLPSMEAAFIDIGKGRNAVLYAGEVNWSALGHKDGQPRKIESVLSSGQTVLVQVTKDPIGHKGARLTSQVSLAGRFLVYVPDGTTSGISRKLPDTERNRLKTLLKEIVPDTAGVIVRTAAEGASEDELTRDVERLKARWEDIEAQGQGQRPAAAVRRAGPDPQGRPRPVHRGLRQAGHPGRRRLGHRAGLRRSTSRPTSRSASSATSPAPNGDGGKADVFAEYRIEEQIAKGLDRKVWLPSGGSLVIDRTEAMTVVDVNTGKFTGSGGNLEETVTKNNLEAAEEIVRQLRLRDIGGIIVVDFIDMVLESNRDLVLRRLVECLGRDRTRHQVAEVTSLGLVQMTRKRIGTGLVEAFSENCEHCQGRGVVDPGHPGRAEGRRRRRAASRWRRSRGRGRGGGRRRPRPWPRAGLRQGHRQAAPARATAGRTPARRPRPRTSPRWRAPRTPSAEDAPASRPGRDPVEARPPRSSRRSRSPVEEPAEAPARRAVTASRPRPRSTTRSRRRSASRGPPAEPAPVAAAEAAARGRRSPSVRAAPVAEAVGAAGAAEGRHPHPRSQSADPARRSAGRDAAARSRPTTVDGTADAEPGAATHPHVEHVPIKKKGSRKR